MVDYLNDTTILYVEEDESFRVKVAPFLLKMCRSLYVAKDGLEGLDLWEEYHPKLVICSVQMPKLCGIEMANRMRVVIPDQIIVFTTAPSDIAYMARATAIGANTYIPKSVDPRYLKETLEMLVNDECSVS